MSDNNNGVVAPDDGAQPNGELADGAIDTALETAEKEVVDTRAIKAEQEAAELRQHLRALQEANTELRNTSRKQSEMISAIYGDIQSAKDRGLQYERQQLQAWQRKAAQEADVAAHDEATRQLQMLEHQQRTVAEPKPADQTRQPNPPQGQVDPAAAAWLADNPWMQNPKMFREAAALETNIHEDKPYLSTADRLKEVKAEMMKRYPDKFPGQQQRPQTPTVSRPGPQAAAKAKPKQKTLTELDPDAQAAFRQLKRMNPEYTEAQYLKDYKE